MSLIVAVKEISGIGAISRASPFAGRRRLAASGIGPTGADRWSPGSVIFKNSAAADALQVRIAWLT
jgi:hypothetical protein